MPDFFTQIGFGGMSSVNEATQSENVEDSTHARRQSPKWTTDQNLVLLSGWIKYGTANVFGRNKKSEAYWDKIDEYLTSIAHLILREMELRAETITTI